MHAHAHAHMHAVHLEVLSYVLFWVHPGDFQLAGKSKRRHLHFTPLGQDVSNRFLKVNGRWTTAAPGSSGYRLENKQGNAYGVFLYLWQELAGSQAEQFSLARFRVSLTSLHY